jgi:hypothetical protein
MASPLTDTDKQRLIDLRHEGLTWAECSEQLGRSADVLRSVGCRLRDAGEWSLTDGGEAQGAPRAGKRGRPRNKIPTAAVSLRFAPAVEEALRDVADAAGMSGRVGLVVAEAVERALARAKGKRVSATPLELEPGEVAELSDEARLHTLSCNIPQPLFDEFVALRPGLCRMTAVVEAVHRLLADLNYKFVEPSQ